MDQADQVGVVFDGWAGDHRAPGMEKGHWPVVRQAFDLVPEMVGDYLEIGVGNGYGLRHMATGPFRAGRCFGIDIAPGMVSLASERTAGLGNVTVAQADFMKWQPPVGQTFSLIFSMEVFYYLSDIRAGLQRAVSMLRPGGMLMVMVDFYRENGDCHDWPQQLGVPMQMWSMQEYREGMAAAGLTLIDQRLLSDASRTPSPPPTLCTWGSMG